MNTVNFEKRSASIIATFGRIPQIIIAMNSLFIDHRVWSFEKKRNVYMKEGSGATESTHEVYLQKKRLMHQNIIKIHLI